MAQIMDLMKMPEQAKLIRSYQPQQDPIQEQLKQLELQKLYLENEVLKASIADKYARAGENEVDKELKLAKAAVESAKARKLQSDADLVDLNFIAKDNGSDLQAKLAIEEFKRKANLDSLAFQAMRNDSQLGVLR